MRNVAQCLCLANLFALLIASSTQHDDEQLLAKGGHFISSNAIAINCDSQRQGFRTKAASGKAEKAIGVVDIPCG